MVRDGNSYPAGDESTFEEKSSFLLEKNLPFFIERVYKPLKDANLLVKGSGKTKKLNDSLINEYKASFGQLFKILLDYKTVVAEKFGGKSKQAAAISALLNNVIEINQQLPKMTHEVTVKKSLFSLKHQLTPSIKVKTKIVQTIKIYEAIITKIY